MVRAEAMIRTGYWTQIAAEFVDLPTDALETVDDDSVGILLCNKYTAAPGSGL